MPRLYPVMNLPYPFPPGLRVDLARPDRGSGDQEDDADRETIIVD